jgi:hypothetical protein
MLSLHIGTEVFCCHQGDQIGRIFAFWASVNLGLLNSTSSQNIWATFLQNKIFNLTKYEWVGLSFGRL